MWDVGRTGRINKFIFFALTLQKMMIMLHEYVHNIYVKTGPSTECFFEGLVAACHSFRFVDDISIKKYNV